MMKVLLYNPPMPYSGKSHKQTPLGLCYLSSAIKDKVKCVVFDGNVQEGFSKYVTDFKPDIIGISILTATFNSSVRVAKKLKKIVPKCLLIAGGIHPSVFPEETLNHGFDIVIRGEGEITFQEIIDVLKIQKTQPMCVNSLYGIKGISYNNGGEIIHNADREFLKDLDKLVFPDRSNLPLEKYEHDSIMTSRGCGFNCFYCSSSYYWGQNVRYRTAKNVFREILEITAMGVKKIYFCDDNFTFNHKLVTELCNLIIENGVEIEWSALTRIDTVNMELLILMKKAGCEILALGIENGTRCFMKKTKRTTYKGTIKAFEMIKRANIKTRTTWIVGLGKTLEEEKESFELMKIILPDQVSVHCLIPFPNTDAWNYPEKYNLIIDKDNMNWDVMNMTYSPYLLDYIKFRHISKTQIIDLLNEVKREMISYGYDGKTRIFETFIEDQIVSVLSGEEYC